MSKIEDALKKARTKGSLRPQDTGLEIDTPRFPAVIESKTPDVDLEALPGKEITRMAESRWLNNNALAENKIIYPEMQDTRVANAFREIRTKILQLTKGRNCTLMVTSPSMGSGSSFVALNLAVSFTFDAQMTALLIDCNLADPSCQNLVPAGKDHGLTDYLEADEIRVEKIIHPVGIKRLRLIPAGGKRATAAEFFTSAKMRKLLASVKERYKDRHVIIDAPSVTQSADARILAEVCDYALLVVPYGKVTESQIQSAVKTIGEHKLLGVIFNDEPQLPRPSWRKKMSFSADSLKTFAKNKLNSKKYSKGER